MDASTLRDAAWATARERILTGTPAVSGQPQLDALLAAVAALDAAGVPHCLIGGLAVGVLSGVPRATLDVDLAVPSTSPASELVAAMVAAGFRAAGAFGHSLNFRAPSGEPVQLAFDVEFDAMIARALPLRVGAVEVRVVQRDDLVRMKRRAAADPARRKSKALRDLADVELLLGDVPEPDEGW